MCGGNQRKASARLAFAGLALVVIGVACERGAARASLAVTDTGDTHPRVREILAQRCVRAGGRQTLTVRMEAGSFTYGTTYADGESGRKAPYGAGYGGDGLGSSTDGVVRERWTVAKDAPRGLAIVYVSALLFDEGLAADPDLLKRLRASFWVVGPKEGCPEKGDPDFPAPRVVTDTEDDHARVRATLAKGCVRADDRQVLKVRAENAARVTYNSIYRNGENGRPIPNGGGYGGSGWGIAGEGGMEQSWIVDKDVPPGVVTVLVAVHGAEKRPTRLKVSFLVPAAEDRCP